MNTPDLDLNRWTEAVETQRAEGRADPKIADELWKALCSELGLSTLLPRDEQNENDAERNAEVWAILNQAVTFHRAISFTANLQGEPVEGEAARNAEWDALMSAHVPEEQVASSGDLGFLQVQVREFDGEFKRLEAKGLRRMWLELLKRLGA